MNTNNLNFSFNNVNNYENDQRNMNEMLKKKQTMDESSSISEKSLASHYKIKGDIKKPIKRFVNHPGAKDERSRQIKNNKIVYVIHGNKKPPQQENREVEEAKNEETFKIDENFEEFQNEIASNSNHNNSETTANGKKTEGFKI